MKILRIIVTEMVCHYVASSFWASLMKQSLKTSAQLERVSTSSFKVRLILLDQRVIKIHDTKPCFSGFLETRAFQSIRKIDGALRPNCTSGRTIKGKIMFNVQRN